LQESTEVDRRDDVQAALVPDAKRQVHDLHDVPGPGRHLSVGRKIAAAFRLPEADEAGQDAGRAVRAGRRGLRHVYAIARVVLGLQVTQRPRVFRVPTRLLRRLRRAAGRGQGHDIHGGARRDEELLLGQRAVAGRADQREDERTSTVAARAITDGR